MKPDLKGITLSVIKTPAKKVRFESVSMRDQYEKYSPGVAKTVAVYDAAALNCLTLANKQNKSVLLGMLVGLSAYLICRLIFLCVCQFSPWNRVVF